MDCRAFVKSQREMFEGVFLQNRFLIQDKLCKSDSFGMMFKGLDTQTQNIVVIKISRKLNMNYREYQILTKLNLIPEQKYFPLYYGSGNFKHINPATKQEENLSFLAIEHLGLTLRDYFYSRGKPFSINTVCLIGIQLVEALQIFHDQTGYIHNDIKLENILVGSDKDGLQQLKLIDFGVSRPFLDEFGQHLKLEDVDFSGNIVFCSPHSMQQITLGRRDDLISLTYLLLYLSEGNLEFLIKDNSYFNDFKQMRIAKLNATPESLCGQTSQHFHDFVKEVLSIGFAERPDYAKLRQCLITTMLFKGDPLSFKFDWISKEMNNETMSDASENFATHKLVQQKLLDVLDEINNNDDQSKNFEVANALFDVLIQKEKDEESAQPSSSYNFEGGCLSIGGVKISIQDFLISLNMGKYSNSQNKPERSLEDMFSSMSIVNKTLKTDAKTHMSLKINN